MSFIDFWLAVSFLASRIVIVSGSSLLFFYCLHAKKKREAVFILTSISGGVILSYVLKRILQIPRPSDALIPIDGYAFPSGHAMSAVIFYSLLILLFHKKIKNKVAKNSFIFANVLIILLIGLSRVMLKVHYVRDVLAGYVVGLLWICILYKMLEKIKL